MDATASEMHTSLPEPPTPSPFGPMTKIIGTLGAHSRDVETISELLNAGMSVARFGFSPGDEAYSYQETLANLETAVQKTGKLCAVMLEAAEPQFGTVDMRKLSIDFLCVSFASSAADVRFARECISSPGGLYQPQILARIETAGGVRHFTEIANEADGIILSLGNLIHIGLSPEFILHKQKEALHWCKTRGKLVIFTPIDDPGNDTHLPSYSEALDVASAVRDGADAILLGAEKHWRSNPVDTISTLRKICTVGEEMFNEVEFSNSILNAPENPKDDHESDAASAVRDASTAGASVIVVFITSTSIRAARLVAKYKPRMPVIVVIPEVSTNQMSWALQAARQCLAVRGLSPVLVDKTLTTESSTSTTLTKHLLLYRAMELWKKAGFIKEHDKVVIFSEAEPGGIPIVDVIQPVP